jgi:hypothetical protein
MGRLPGDSQIMHPAFAHASSFAWKSPHPHHHGDPLLQKHLNLTSCTQLSCTLPPPPPAPQAAVSREGHILWICQLTFTSLYHRFGFTYLSPAPQTGCVCLIFWTRLELQRWEWKRNRKIMGYKCKQTSLYLHFNDVEGFFFFKYFFWGGGWFYCCCFGLLFIIIIFKFWDYSLVTMLVPLPFPLFNTFCVSTLHSLSLIHGLFCFNCFFLHMYYIYIYIHITHTYTYIYTYIYTHIYVYITHTYIHICVYIIHIHIYVYITHTYVYHTHTHIYATCSEHIMYIYDLRADQLILDNQLCGLLPREDISPTLSIPFCLQFFVQGWS